MKMIKFNLKGNFTIVPEGNRTLEIIEATVTPSGAPNKLNLVWKDTDGGTIKESIDLEGKFVWKVGVICQYALGVQDGEEMDVKDMAAALLHKKLVCEVVHTQGKTQREDGTYPTFANVRRVLGTAEETTQTATTTSNPRQAIVEDDL